MKVYICPIIPSKILKTIESVLTKYNSKLRIKDVEIRLISKSPFDPETNFSLSFNINPIRAYHRSYNFHPYEELMIKLEKSLSSSVKKHGCKVIDWNAGADDVDFELSFESIDE